MKYTDYNSLYLNAKKQMQNKSREVQSPVSEAKPEPVVTPVIQEEPPATEPVKEQDEEKPVHAKPELESAPAPTPVPVAEKEEPEETQSPVQNTPFSGIGNNSDDLDSFASEFDHKQEEAVFVEPVSSSMPAAPVRQEPVHMPEESDDEEESVEKQRKEAFKRPSVYTPKKKSEDDGSYEMSHVRDIPKVLITRVQQLFSCRPNMGDALAAYIYLKEGCPADINVPDRVKEVAKTYCGEIVSNEDIQADFMAELNKIKNNDKQLMQKINAIELAVTYAVFDRLGFRKDDIVNKTAGQINFTEAGMHELLDNLEASSINYQTRVKKSEGRMKI